LCFALFQARPVTLEELKIREGIATILLEKLQKPTTNLLSGENKYIACE
jgi:hypothetical protein